MIVLIGVDEFIGDCIVRQLIVVVVRGVLEVHVDIAAVAIYRFCTCYVAVGVYCSRGLKLRRREHLAKRLNCQLTLH